MRKKKKKTRFKWWVKGCLNECVLNECDFKLNWKLISTDKQKTFLLIKPNFCKQGHPIFVQFFWYKLYFFVKKKASLVSLEIYVKRKEYDWNYWMFVVVQKIINGKSLISDCPLWLVEVPTITYVYPKIKIWNYF